MFRVIIGSMLEIKLPTVESIEVLDVAGPRNVFAYIKSSENLTGKKYISEFC